jgi:hypothetical protein
MSCFSRISRRSCLSLLASPALFILACPRPAWSASPYPVARYFIPSLWMGDGTSPQPYVQYERKSAEAYHTEPSSERWSYSPDDDALGWAAVGYVFPENNVGDKKGKDLSGRGYTRLTFWARGLNGGEQVQFKAGDHTKSGAKYPASFEAATPILTLTHTWQQYAIDLTGKDLSNVTCGFVWLARQEDQEDASIPVIFFIDDVQYE